MSNDGHDKTMTSAEDEVSLTYKDPENGCLGGCLKIFLVALGVLGIPLLMIIFAGFSTKEYALCSEIKNIVIDMDKPNLQGFYSFKVEKWQTKLELEGKDQAHGCIDNSEDNLTDQCLQYGGMIRPQTMKGKWVLINEGLYTDPYGLHIGPGNRMDFIGLKQGSLIVYIPLFSFSNVYEPLEKIHPPYYERLAASKQVLCEEI